MTQGALNEEGPQQKRKCDLHILGRFQEGVASGQNAKLTRVGREEGNESQCLTRQLIFFTTLMFRRVTERQGKNSRLLDWYSLRRATTVLKSKVG